MEPEYFPYKCPHCSVVRNAADVVKELPREVLLPQTRSILSRQRRKRAAGPGRPSLARCPGCSQEMSAAELREHRIPCVRSELKKSMDHPFQIFPKDPDQYPNFYLHRPPDDDAAEVEFRKGSNSDIITIDLRKIADITRVDDGEPITHIRVLGRVEWRGDIQRWRFAPTAAVGRRPLVERRS